MRRTRKTEVPRAVSGGCFASGGRRCEFPIHRHRRALFVYVTEGVLHCEVGDDIWIVPPQCVLWLPGGVVHRAYAFGPYESHSVWVDTGTGLPATCCIASVSPLLRQLLLRATEFADTPTADGAQSRVLSVIVDEIMRLPWETLRLPIPRDPRLKRLFDSLIADPSDKATAADLAARFALSERTMSRLFLKDVGMSFGRWRRQLHVTIALQSMANGSSVQDVAFQLGYESASGFITMFRKTLGRPPRRYLSDWQAKAQGGFVPPSDGSRREPTTEQTSDGHHGQFEPIGSRMS